MHYAAHLMATVNSQTILVFNFNPLIAVQVGSLGDSEVISKLLLLNFLFIFGGTGRPNIKGLLSTLLSSYEGI